MSKLMILYWWTCLLQLMTVAVTTTPLCFWWVFRRSLSIRSGTYWTLKNFFKKQMNKWFSIRPFQTISLLCFPPCRGLHHLDFQSKSGGNGLTQIALYEATRSALMPYFMVLGHSHSFAHPAIHTLAPHLKWSVGYWMIFTLLFAEGGIIRQMSCCPLFRGSLWSQMST